MPSRSSFHSFYHDYESILYYSNGSSAVSVASNPQRVAWTDSVTFGANIKGWRSNLRNGLSATTSMVGSSRTGQYSAGQLYVAKPKSGNLSYAVQVTGDMKLTPSFSSSDPSTLDSSGANRQALGKFVTKAQAKLTAFQGGVFLGELAQTLQTIRNPARGLRKLVDDWRFHAHRVRRASGRIGQYLSKKDLVSRTTRNLADAWLEAQFGWRPLLHDIDDGCKALAIINTGQSLHTSRITAKGEVKSRISETIGYSGAHNAFWKNHVLDESTTMVVYRGAVRVKPISPGTMDPQLLGFDPLSWAPTAWELVPYSFLVDYFTNIGEIIQGWSFLRSNIAWVNKTVRNEYKRVGFSECSLKMVKDHPSSGFPNANQFSFTPAKYICTKASVSRAEYTGDITPDFAFEIPGFRSLRWLNIAALIANRRSDRNWSFGN